MSQTVQPQARPAEGAPRTQSKEVRRRQLIEATITSIAKYGIPGTTTTTITEIARLSLGIVNFHFDSKRKLFDETLLFLALEHQGMWKKAVKARGLSIEDKILAIVDAEYHPKVCSRKKLAVWHAFYGDGGNRTSYRETMDDIDFGRFDTLEKLISGLAGECGIANLNAHDVTTMLEGLFDGLCLTILMYPEQMTRDDAKRQIRSYLAAIFPGRFQVT